MPNRDDDKTTEDLTGEVRALGTTLTGLEDKVDGMDTRLTGLEVKVDEGFKRVAERFDGVDKRIDGIDKRFDKVEERISGLAQETGREFTAVRKEIKDGFDRMQHILIGFSATIIAALIGLIATQI